MIAAVAGAIWNYLFGWAGLDILIGFAAVAVAVLLPAPLAAITDLRKWAVCVAVVAFTLAGAIAHGYKSGLAQKQAEWDRSLGREADRSEKARDDAVRDIGPLTTDRGLFRSDPDNRNRDGRKEVCP